MPAATSSSFTTIGAKALKELVQAASSSTNSDDVDVPGIVWLEHVNLVVGSKALAEEFYLELLGLSKDRSKSFHCNLGQQQFHLAENGDPAQRVTGSIGLAVPSIKRVRERIESALLDDNNKWKVTQLAILQQQDDDDILSVVCPWGNRFHLYDLTMEEESLSAPTLSKSKMVNLHAEGGTYSSQRMAVRGQPGIRYVEIACRPGTVSRLANFYETVLHCSVHHKPTSDDSNHESIAVSVGPGVHLVYSEDSSLTEKDMASMEGVHICIYVDRFQELYQRLSSQGMIWTNPRFTHLDSCDSWEEAKGSRTLRFKDIIRDEETRNVLVELEHETRPMRHGQYMKVPFYEPK